MSTRRSKTIFRYAMRLEAAHYGKQSIYPPAIRASLRLCFPPKRTTQEERDMRRLHRLTQSFEATGDVRAWNLEVRTARRQQIESNSEVREVNQATTDDTPEGAEYKCTCGGFVFLKDYHYIFYPEPDCCCFYFQCAGCGTRIAQHDQERFRAQFKDIS